MMQNNVIGHYEGTAVYNQGDLCYYAWKYPKRNKKKSSEQVASWQQWGTKDIHTESFCVVKHLLYRRENILINMYIYTKYDAYVNQCVILTEEIM